MITYLIGEVVSVTQDRLILDVNHVGFQIYINGRDAAAMPRRGSQVRIHTYMSVREDGISLFGFLSEDDLLIYRMLIGVSGIGPKGGLAILSAMSGDDLRFAVLSDDAAAICRAPGIGKKTAQKLILELKDKFNLEETISAKLDAGEQRNAGGTLSDASAETVAALTALGYGASEAMRAVREVPDADELDTSALLKAALRILSGR